MLHNTLIQLRAIEPEDLELMYAWENNPEVWQISHTTAPFSRFVLRQYIEHSHQDIYEARQLRLMIDLRPDAQRHQPETIGTVDLFDFDPFHLRAGVGILINRSDLRHQGYGTQALRLLVEYGFGHLHLHQLYCNILLTNTASVQLFGQAGFEPCGVKKDWVRTSDGWADEAMFQLINPKHRLSAN